jgi:hypothetical protein
VARSLCYASATLALPWGSSNVGHKKKTAMFYIFALIVMLVPTVFGGYLLFAPMKKLIASVAWMRLPMPEEGTAAHFALQCFWRSIGVIAWLFAALMAYVLFIRKT